MRKILFYILIFFCFSCNHNTLGLFRKNIIGAWNVKKIIFKKNDITYCFPLHSIGINKDNTVFLPSYLKDCFLNSASQNILKGVWDISIKDDTYILNIQTENIVFNRQFVANFKTNNLDNSIILTLDSQECNIECVRKGLIDKRSYDEIQELSR